MGNIELSLMKKTILVLRDWDAFQAICRQGLKLVRLEGADRVKKRTSEALKASGISETC